MTKIKKKDCFYAYILLLPLFIGLSIFYIIPFFQTLFFSFTDLSAFGKYSNISIDNYTRLFSSKEIRKALINTFILAFIAVPVITFVSILLSCLLNIKMKGIHFYRVFFLIPSIMMPSLVALIWRWLLSTDYGLLNNTLRFFSLPAPSWISDKSVVLAAVILVYIWSRVGYNTIIFLAGLQDIPEVYYEAASLDGAGSFNKFFNITLPLLSPSILFVLVTSFIDAFQVFDLIFIMITDESLAIENAQTAVYTFYKYAFIFHEKGYASAIAMVIFIIIMFFTLAQIKLQYRYVNYEK